MSTGLQVANKRLWCAIVQQGDYGQQIINDTTQITKTMDF